MALSLKLPLNFFFSTQCIILLLFLLFSQIKIGGGGTFITKVYLPLIITMVKNVIVEKRYDIIIISINLAIVNRYKEEKNHLLYTYTNTSRGKSGSGQQKGRLFILQDKSTDVFSLLVNAMIVHCFRH